MKLSQLKEQVRNILRERSVKAIQKDYSNVVSEMEKHLELYKKAKGTPDEKKHIQHLKSLTDKKKKLQSELDSAVAGLYKNAELKVDEAITNPKKSNPNDLAKTVIGWYDFNTNYIDNGGQRRTAIKRNDDVVKWFDSHPLDVKQPAFKVMLSTQPSLKSDIQKVFGSSLKENVVNEDIKSDINKFVDKLNKQFPDQEYVVSSGGGKYMRINHKRANGGQESVWGFIALVDNPQKGLKVGDLLKAAGYNTPAKHARGNILNGTAKYDKYSPTYLKEDVVNEVKTYKKGDKLKIKLPNGKKFDVVFDMYSRTKGVALGKFKNDDGEYNIKPFGLDTIVESVINEDTRSVKLLGIDFKVSEMNGRIFFSFVDKKAASVSLRQVGTNKIVNHIQKRLDIAYGKGTFFFKSGDHAEFQNGYLFQRNTPDINLNKLKFESVNEASEPEIISQLKDIVKNQQYQSIKDPKTGKKVKVDMQTANAVLQIYNGLSNVNKDNMVKMGLPKMIEVAWKIISKYR
jgi:hypothetical protein